MSDTSFSEDEEITEIPVIPVTDFRTKDGAFEHRLPPMSQTENPQAYLEEHSDVHLPPASIRRIALGAVEPAELDGIRVEKHRVENGWLSVISYRAYTTMASLAIENDRLLADAHYSADPSPDGGGRMALAMPRAHEKHAVLMHTASFQNVLETVDRSAIKVLAENRQDVGDRIIERPLMLVPSTFRGADDSPVDDATAVDGNCRLTSAFGCISVTQGWVDDALTGEERKKLVPLRPSHLMRLSLDARRELTRQVIKAAHQRLAKPRTGTDNDLKARNKAARTLNAMTIPVQVIVGYRDDEPERGMHRFPVAVRALLMRMNVGVKPFTSEAKNAVSAEEIIVGLHDDRLLGDGSGIVAWRDALIGRGDVAGAMQELGLDPQWRDLRFALVIHQLTRKSPRFNARMRSKLGLPGNLTLARRNGPVVELGLRSYSASDSKSARLALETGCLWQDLIGGSWSVENINTDEEVDKLLEDADSDSAAAMLLGTLGMIAFVMSGHLLAAAGSAEAIVETTIDRGSVGDITRKLLEKETGRLLLADAIKRTRAGKAPRWFDEARQELVDYPAEWKGSTYNAHLRSAVRHGFKHEVKQDTEAVREATALTRFQEGLVEADSRLTDLIDLREKHNTIDLIPWIDTEASFAQIDNLASDLRSITEPKPRTR
ncbi:hypothetical protein [Streptomyces goshikiensis]|uniref:hypothetical protein n=1 Tax=Streptomyces goshikiensis TaxID=1942 RepID=UPI00383019F5